MNEPERVNMSIPGGGDHLTNLAPKFPPQNFDVPDINFSNSVTPNVDFDQIMFTSSQMLSQSSSLFATSAGHVMDEQPTSSHSGVGITMQTSPSTQMGRPGFFPSAANSPPGTSSSDDSDDLPLAQLAKRGGSHGARSTTPSPSTPTMISANVQTSPKESSPGPVAKKTKTTRKKKKKDPNEPQKPVSAYALFFRDTQATIKTHNPSASFGEVSKIVASMWDQLDPEHKEVYKKKTEMAKKQYLKQLAAYRASQVSQSVTEDNDKAPCPSPPSVPATTAMMGSNPGVPLSVNSGIQNPIGQVGAVLTSAPATGPIMSPPQMQQSQNMMAMAPQMMQQQQIQQQQQMQQQMQHQQHIQQQMNVVRQMSPQQQQQSPRQYQSPPQAYNSPPHMTQTVLPPPAPTAYHSQQTQIGFTNTNQNIEMANYPSCVRSGCNKRAVESPGWDNEYCSNDCVITHCRDIFTSWAASRSGTNTFPVK